LPARRSTWRRRLLRLVALGFGAAALAGMAAPAQLAGDMGLFLNGVNGYSQFYAMYVGTSLAIAGLALFAARNGHQPILGDITALLVLAQPLGRLLAALSFGLPRGLLLVACGAELAGGLLLLLLRPAARPERRAAAP